MTEAACECGTPGHFQEGTTINALRAKCLVQIRDVPLMLVVERHGLTLLSRPWAA